MKLAELSPEEMAFLSTAPVASDDLQLRLPQRLATTLSARLRMPVHMVAQTIEMPTATLIAPNWQIDAALSTLWVTRRLGGHRMLGQASFVPPSLARTLDAVLAECWLDTPAQPAVPTSLAWRITTQLAQATLGVQLPQHTTDMTRWARGVIRHD